MNGAESLIQTAVAAGVTVCFANPGTTEMPLVAALDAVPGLRAVLGLFEGVCTGAADGYGRMADQPALTLLHLGPGFANGIANLHNARRARTPIVNLIGDHATWHVAADPPLASDIPSLARPVSSWVRTTRSPQELAGDTAAAIAAAASPPGQIATLIVPADCQWGPADGPAPPLPAPSAPSVAGDVIEGVAQALRQSDRAALLLGGRALREPGLRAAARVAAATNCRLIGEGFPARLERGAGLPALESLAYFPEQATAQLAEAGLIVLAGALDPVAFFGYPDLPSALIPEGQPRRVLARPEEDIVQALEALADAVGAPPAPSLPPVEAPQRPTGALTAATLARAVAALQPEGAIIMDESITLRAAYLAASGGAPPHSYLMVTGGAIGQGLPCATGAAVACPDRRVICLQADGSAMYTLQALWTQAREQLDVTTVLCSNRSYKILQVELARAGLTAPGPRAQALTELARPALDWVQLSRGLGVPAARAEAADALVQALERSLAEPGPQLIEAVL